MTALIITGVVCLFVGWLVPEPQWAKDLVAKIRSIFHLPDA